MEKRGFSTLFAVIMLLFIISIAPSMMDNNFSYPDQWQDFSKIKQAQAATLNNQITYYINTGYVKTAESVLAATDLSNSPEEIKVLGVSTEKSNAVLTYQAKEVGRSFRVLNINPGKAITFWIDFLNTGTATWSNQGKNFLVANVTDPAGRQSAFQYPSWIKYYQPAKLLQTRVRPGEVGRFRFVLKAPATTGIYSEKFNLVVENLTWVDGGYFEIKIGVGEKVIPPPDYQAEEVSRSFSDSLKMDPGKGITVWIDFKNTGLKTWYKDDKNFLAVNVTNPTGRYSFFQHKFWPKYYRPAKLMNDRVYPGEVGRFRFALQAPDRIGHYTEDFNLVAENHSFIKGGLFSMSITVGEPYIPPAVAPIANEPLVRVGLYNTTEPTQVTASGTYEIHDGNNNLLATKNASEATTVNFLNNTYTITETNQTSATYLRFVPQSVDTIMEIVSYKNPPAWNSELNDNKFRGTLEVRYSENTSKLWVINELPLESYLRGLAEVCNEQPEEYLKSLIIAARSYALWHMVHGGKHATEYYDINATTDQVYRGYGFEQRSIDPLKAALATQGQVITHLQAIDELNPQGIAIAAYSSGTDGRTRSWQEVWAGEYPWLVTVEDPYGILPNALTLEGNHMVGLSAQGARGYATKESKTYDWILKHYYTGVEIVKLY